MFDCFSFFYDFIIILLSIDKLCHTDLYFILICNTLSVSIFACFASQVFSIDTKFIEFDQVTSLNDSSLKLLPRTRDVYSRRRYAGLTFGWPPFSKWHVGSYFSAQQWESCCPLDMLTRCQRYTWVHSCEIPFFSDSIPELRILRIFSEKIFSKKKYFITRLHL